MLLPLGAWTALKRMVRREGEETLSFRLSSDLSEYGREWRLPPVEGRRMTQQLYRRLLGAGICFVALVAGASAAGSRTPVRTTSDQGSFRFRLHQLPAHTGPTMLVTGPDGNLWFSNVGSNDIRRFEVATQRMSVFPLPQPHSRVLVMAAGPDGNVWYADGNSSGKFGNITPAGKITEFNMPRNVGAAGVGTGPDGNIWITEGVNDKIARFDLKSKSFTEFALPHPNSGPCKVTTGSDGNVWFTELVGGRIGRLTLGGQLTEFPLPHASRQPQPFMIVSGPDGALWFTEYNGGKIGRITTAGQITEFPTSNVANFPMHIVVGPDKDLWFTEVGGSALGRITTGGALTEFRFGGSTSPDGIAVGSDSRIWFTQYTANTLGTVLSPR
jgi:streptogramin lyase